MVDDVKPRRSYRSTKRAEQVAQSRRDILTTAGALFRAHGYAGVSMPSIAAEAGVAVETIYRGFGSKAGLFSGVVDAAVAGGTSRAEVPVEQRPAIRAIIEEPDPRRQVERYAATQPGIHRRAGPLLRVLRDAATSDRELRALWQSIETDRRNGQSGFIGMLAGRGVLRPGLSVDEATDGLWTLTSLDVWDLLVTKRGWTAERYERWLADALIAYLLPVIRPSEGPGLRDY
jgi:AcrR family transcriptional regulator